MTKTLREHQVRAIDQLRESLRSGRKRPVLKLPTGSGKTLIASRIISSAVGRGKRVLFVVDAIELIDQTVAAFYNDGLHGIGVIQANHPMTDYSRPIQVASVQTLARRDCPPFDLCIVDECHARYATVDKLMSDNPTVPFIGLSATPWAKGMGLLYDDLIQPASIRELTDAGYVAKLRAYAPAHPDLTGVKVRAGDYDETQLSRVMRGETLVADVVSTWKQLGENRPTFCFCVDLAHAETMRDRFEQAGIGAGYIDGKTPVIDRKAVRRDLESGKIKVVCSVGTMIKGVDWVVGCIIDAQPTKSLMRHVQKLGRMRPHLEWEYALVLDHSDNLLRLGLPMDIHRSELCKAAKGEKQTKEAETGALPKGCPKCSAVRPAGTKVCPACGFEPVRHSDMKEGAGSLAEVGGAGSGPKKAEWSPRAKELCYRELLGWCQIHNKPERQAAGKYKDRFGHWPPKKNGLAPLLPSTDTEMWIKASQIRYAKAMERKNARA